MRSEFLSSNRDPEKKREKTYRIKANNQEQLIRNKMNLMQLPDAKRQVSESYVNIILIWKLNTNNKIIPSPSLLPGL